MELIEKLFHKDKLNLSYSFKVKDLDAVFIVNVKNGTIRYIELPSSMVNYTFEVEVVNKSLIPFHIVNFQFDKRKKEQLLDKFLSLEIRIISDQEPYSTELLEEIRDIYILPNQLLKGFINCNIHQELVPYLQINIAGYETEPGVANLSKNQRS